MSLLNLSGIRISSVALVLVSLVNCGEKKKDNKSSSAPSKEYTPGPVSQQSQNQNCINPQNLPAGVSSQQINKIAQLLKGLDFNALLSDPELMKLIDKDAIEKLATQGGIPTNLDDSAALIAYLKAILKSSNTQNTATSTSSSTNTSTNTNTSVSLTETDPHTSTSSPANTDPQTNVICSTDSGSGNGSTSTWSTTSSWSTTSTTTKTDTGTSTSTQTGSVVIPINR